MSVGDDDVVHEVDAHQFTGALDVFSQFSVGFAGCETARGVVVTDGKDGRVGKYGLTYDDTDIDGCLGDATT